MARRSPWLTTATALALAVAVGCSRHKPAAPVADNPEGPTPGVRPPAGSQPQPGSQAQPGAETQPGVQAQPVTGQVLVEGRPTSLAFSPDGRLLVAGNDTYPPTLI